MSEANKALIRQNLKAISNKDLDSFTGSYAADVAYHGAGGLEVKGAKELTEFLNTFLVAFPDLAINVDDIIAEGDKVVVRATAGGTHTGDLQGIPPTGKSVPMLAMIIYRMSGGKIAEQWEIDDQMGMMQQLGVIPAPGESG